MLTNHALQLAADTLNGIMVNGLKISIDKAAFCDPVLRVELVDKDGRPIVHVVDQVLHYGDSLTLTGIERSLHVRLS